MTLQEKLIGRHPNDGFFFDWVKVEDTECSDHKRIRHLSETDIEKEDAHQEITKWLIKHHLADGERNKLDRKKALLEKYQFSDYARTIKVFPEADKTKKGNFGEIILSEYLSVMNGIEILVYKLHYNPNVDQAMKGDDVLLISLSSGDIFLGESKFRKKASKSMIDEISKSLGDGKLPLSLDFVSNCLFERGMV